MKSARCSLSQLLHSEGLRFNTSYYVNDAVDYYEGLVKCPYSITKLGDEAERIFLCNIFSRCFVKDADHGVPYMTPSEMLRFDMGQAKLLSKKQAEDLPHLRVKRGWILISCSGSAALGSVVQADERHERMIATHDLIRFIPNEKNLKSGVVVAFLKSKYGKATLTHSQYGSCILHINRDHVSAIRIPIFPEQFQKRVHKLIDESLRLREEASRLEGDAQCKLRQYTGLSALSPDDYNYFGARPASREISVFSRRLSAMSELTFQAFNYSERTRKWIEYCKRTCNCVSLRDVLDEREFFSTGSFPRLELDSPKSYLLINQTDIFNLRLSGKKIARRGVKIRNLVQYGEVIIAGVGTLGESETFCRVVFGNEVLTGQLISGEFIRMNTNEKYPSGYLYAWLHSDYGFRLIRSTQAGTKQCRPIQKLLLEMPVPVLERRKMNEIDRLVREAQTKLSTSAELEERAIGAIEAEIKSWQGA